MRFFFSSFFEIHREFNISSKNLQLKSKRNANLKSISLDACAPTGKQALSVHALHEFSIMNVKLCVESSFTKKFKFSDIGLLAQRKKLQIFCKYSCIVNSVSSFTEFTKSLQFTILFLAGTCVISNFSGRVQSGGSYLHVLASHFPRFHPSTSHMALLLVKL